MALNAAKVLVGTADQTTTGAIHNGAVLTTAPADFAAAQTALAAMTASGYVSEDGLELTPEYSTSNILEWNGNTVRTILESFNGTLAWSLIQMDKESWVQALGAEYVEEVSETELHIKMGSHLAPAQSWGFALKDGDTRIIIIVPNGQITTVDAITFNANSAVALPVTLSCYDDGTGNPIHIYIDNSGETNASQGGDDSQQGDDSPANSLSDMTKEELLAYAAEQGIDGVNSSMTKTEIIAVIEAAQG